MNTWKRFFTLPTLKNVIFTDWITHNIEYNVYYKEWSDSKYNKFWYRAQNYSMEFFRKRWVKVEKVRLSNVKYAWGHVIESTEDILSQYNISSMIEIKEEEE